MPLLALIPLILTITAWVVQVLLAIAVLSNNPPQRVLVGRWTWALATLVGGIFVAVVFWVLHYGLPRRPDAQYISVPNGPVEPTFG